jgi:hypothetical protein
MCKHKNDYLSELAPTIKGNILFIFFVFHTVHQGIINTLFTYYIYYYVCIIVFISLYILFIYYFAFNISITSIWDRATFLSSVRQHCKGLTGKRLRLNFKQYRSTARKDLIKSQEASFTTTFHQAELWIQSLSKMKETRSVMLFNGSVESTLVAKLFKYLIREAKNNLFRLKEEQQSYK